ncbi:hypothetical protein BCR33DRAFT_715377 [Rhizoclosmatium globosum]|uniref:Uncharacterized protein n=1 Tax=Rhizoclosmatium globosum TaxID=329046 RepID=A0A1Y2CJG6_9FUNG|nr:hypothetical protein BCR33DRAFT_715377 [Rhizoclosmatium globosum]|eukprot:ORY46994.1 hypothetical protein BCR33DRAFT_715377 [Rhizoclosmatium globosum]
MTILLLSILLHTAVVLSQTVTSLYSQASVTSTPFCYTTTSTTQISTKLTTSLCTTSTSTYTTIKGIATTPTVISSVSSSSTSSTTSSTSTTTSSTSTTTSTTSATFSTSTTSTTSSTTCSFSITTSVSCNYWTATSTSLATFPTVICITTSTTKAPGLPALPTSYPGGAVFAKPDSTISTTGLSDLGYPVGTPQSAGFVNGWYNGVYWRVVGSPPYVAGCYSNPNSPKRDAFQFNNKRAPVSPNATYIPYFFSTQGLDQGYPGSRWMLTINGQTLFCRALLQGAVVLANVTAPPSTPVACVQFDLGTGNVLSATYLQGTLGRAATIKFPTWKSVVGITDVGAPDGNTALNMGFRSGWYNGVYWRVSGAWPNQFVAGGFGLDQGVPGTLVIADVPGIGTTYCRGVGQNADPYMACVLFIGDQVADQYSLYQQLGQWSQYANQFPSS